MKKKRAKVTLTFQFGFGAQCENCSKPVAKSIETQVAHLQEQFEAEMADRFKAMRNQVIDRHPDLGIKIRLGGALL